MSTREFTIRKNFLFPLGLVFILSLLLLILTISREQQTAKAFILAAILLPVALLFVESSLRRVVLDEEALVIRKLFRQKRMIYNEITSVDTVLVRKRAFLSISSESDFIILSNSYAEFATLVGQLLKKVPESTISAETQQMASAPPTKSGDIVSVWLAASLLLLILYVQLGGAF